MKTMLRLSFLLSLLLATGAVALAAADSWETLPDGSSGQAAEFRGADGVRIAAYLRKPQGDGPFPVVVMIHGGGDSKEGTYALGRRTSSPTADFIAQGWAVYSIDFRPKSPFLPVEWDDSCRAVETVRRLPFIDAKRVAVIGGSHGGYVTARVAARCDLSCAISCGPAAIDLVEVARAGQAGFELNPKLTDLIKRMEERYGAPIAKIMADPAAYKHESPLTEVGSVRCPMLLISGRDDSSSPPSVIETYAERLRAAGQEVETYLPHHGPHGFYFGERDRMIPETAEATKRMVAFIRKHFAAVGTAVAADAPPSPAPGVMAWVDPERAQPAPTHFKTFRSGTIGAEVSYVIYLPPDYEAAPARRYPVVYWLHGTGGSPSRGGEFATQLDAAIRAGEAPPMIAVLVNGLRAATMFCDTKDGRWPLESVIIRDLIPHIDVTYRTLARRESRAIEGFSMGGFGAGHLGFKYPEMFGAVSMLAPALLGPDLTGTPAKRWPAHFKFVFSDDLDAFRADDPFALAVANADRIRGRTLIRLVPHDEPEHWFIARCEDLHRVLDQHGIAHEFDPRRDVTKHNFTLVYQALGSRAFSFFRQAFGDRSGLQGATASPSLPIRSAGEGTAATTAPKPLVTPLAEYPAELADSGLSGNAVITLTVKADGTAADAVVKSSDHPAFAKAALAVINQWRFAPGTRDGRPADLKINLPLHFTAPFEQQVNAALKRKVFRPITEPVLPEKDFGSKLVVRETGQPVYPASLARSGAAAAVQMRFVVAPDGTTLNPVALGEPRIDFVAPAVSAIARTTYEPPRRKGAACYVETVATVSFEEAGVSAPTGSGRPTASRPRERPARAGGEDRIKQMFGRLDANHDERLSGDELADERGQRILERFDTDRDGVVTMAEVNGASVGGTRKPGRAEANPAPAAAPVPPAAAPERRRAEEPRAGGVPIQTKTFASAALKKEMTYSVYLPPSYADQPPRRYPVVFWLHGGGGSPRDIWRLAELIDGASRIGKCPEMVIVGVDGRAGRTGSQYSDWKDGSLPMETAIISDLLPHIDATYRTLGTREGRGLEGFSMGGHGALHLAFKHPDLFGAVTALGPALIMPDSGANNVDRVYRTGAYQGDEAYWRLHDPLSIAEKNPAALRGNLRIRLITGEVEGNFTHRRTIELSTKLKALGIENEFIRPGETGHNYAKYYDAMPEAYQFYTQVFAGAKGAEKP